MEIYRIYVTGNGSQTNHQESGDFFVRNMQFPFAWGRYDSLEEAQKDFDHELVEWDEADCMIEDGSKGGYVIAEKWDRSEIQDKDAIDQILHIMVSEYFSYDLEEIDEKEFIFERNGESWKHTYCQPQEGE